MTNKSTSRVTFKLGKLAVRSFERNRLVEPQSGERVAIDHGCSTGSRHYLQASRLALEWVDKVYRARMGLKLRYYLLREQAHAGAAIVIADRPLNAQNDENAGTEHREDILKLGNNRRRRADDNLQVFLSTQ